MPLLLMSALWASIVWVRGAAAGLLPAERHGASRHPFVPAWAVTPRAPGDRLADWLPGCLKTPHPAHAPAHAQTHTLTSSSRLGAKANRRRRNFVTWPVKRAHKQALNTIFICDATRKRIWSNCSSWVGYVIAIISILCSTSALQWQHLFTSSPFMCLCHFARMVLVTWQHHLRGLTDISRQSKAAWFIHHISYTRQLIVLNVN